MTLTLIDTLEWVAYILNQWIALMILIFGLMGNLFNLMIFAGRTFFKQSCSHYFLIASINNITVLLIGLSTRILDDGFKVNLFNGNSNVYCKIRSYLVYTLFAISSWLFVCASLDRLYSTNRSALKRQRFCSSQMSFKLICLTIILCILIHTHIFIFYEYIYKLNPYNQLSLTCIGNNSAYNLFFAFFMLAFYSLLPTILMSIIGALTLNNIRKSHRNIKPFIIRTPIAKRDTNKLIKFLSIQIIMIIILTTPHSCYWIYVAFTSNQNSTKTNLVREYEKFLLHIVRLLLYVNYGSSFYTQILLSKTHRHEFIKLFENIKRRFRNLKL